MEVLTDCRRWTLHRREDDSDTVHQYTQHSRPYRRHQNHTHHSEVPSVLHTQHTVPYTLLNSIYIPSTTRMRSESAYIRQVNFLQLLCRVGEGDSAPLKLNLYLKPFSKYRNNGMEDIGITTLTFHGHVTS